jgi:hypothetical protein
LVSLTGESIDTTKADRKVSDHVRRDHVTAIGYNQDIYGYYRRLECRIQPKE